MEYNLTKKIDGKWVNFGNIKVNQFGNLQASFKNTGELKELVLQGGEWINFAMFEKKPKDAAPISEHSKAKADGYVKPAPTKDEDLPFDDEIPF